VAVITTAAAHPNMSWWSGIFGRHHQHHLRGAQYGEKRARFVLSTQDMDYR
jgi:hypothetical protein